MKRPLYTLIIAAAALIAFTYIAQADDTGFLSPDTATVDDSIGTTDWFLTDNILASDDFRAFSGTGASTCTNTVTDVRLVVAGSIAGDDRAGNEAFNTLDTTVALGGAADLWGVSLSPDDVNATDFGYGVSFTGQSATSKYIVATGFDLAIPTNATIDGVEVSFEGGCSSASVRMDYMSLKVYYTETAATPDTPTTQMQIRNGNINVNNGSVIIRPI